MDSRIVSSARRLDFTPVFAIVMLVFFALAMNQFTRSWSDATHGLILFERAQKDLYVDEELALASERVHVREPLAQRLRDETVLVLTRISARRAIEGTGVIVGVHGNELIILTARHVVEHRGQRSVRFHSQRAAIVRRVIVDAKDDLALLFVAVAPGNYSRATIAANDFATGDRFVVVGHPGDRSWAATPGIAEHHLHLTLLYCPRCDRGDSGAGAYDMHGALRGIVTRKLEITAPAAHGDRYVNVTAFSTVRADRVRAFLHMSCGPGLCRG